MDYEFHLDSALVKPTQERWLKLQDFILHLKSKHVFDCKMFDVSNWVASLNGENGPGGTPSHEALSVFTSKSTGNFLNHWTASFLGQNAHPGWWQNPANVMQGSDLHPKTTVSNSLQTPQTKLGALT